MLILYNIIIFIFGLIIGSFLNVVIYRLENGDKIINDRSRCLSCKHTLNWFDLIPILSFIFLKGKCRYCNSKISWQYPLVEIGTGILFVLIFNFQFSIFNQYSIFNIQYFYLLFWLYITAAFIVIFVYDLKHYIIPDKVIYPAIIITTIFRLFSEFIVDNNIQYSIFNISAQSGPVLGWQFSNFIFAAFIASFFFYSIIILTKGKGMGGGDVKLAFLMGLFLGWPVILLSIFLSFIFGSIIGIYLILIGKKKMGSMIPFGPFLIIGTFVGLFWGERIVEWYINSILS